MHKGEEKAVKKIELPISLMHSKLLYELCLFTVLVIAVFVRVYHFGDIPGGFNQDGAMAAVDAKALAEYGTDRYGMRYPVHLTAWGFGQMSSLLSYLMAGMIKLFGFSNITVRLPLLLVSLAGLVCLFFLVYEVFGKEAALLAGFIGAINPWHILQSRWALDCNLFPHFLLFGVFFLQHAFRSKKKKMFLTLSMFFFGLSMYCYGVSIYTTTCFLLLALIYLICIRKVKWTEVILSFVVYLLIAGPFLLTMAVNAFEWDTIKLAIFTIPYFENSVRSNDILFFSQNMGAQFVNNLKSLFAVTILQSGDLPWNNIEKFGTVYRFTYPFVFAGLLQFFRKERKNIGAVLTMLFLAAGIVNGLLTANVNINRINCIYYPIIILAVYGMKEIIALAGKYKIPVGIVIVGAYFFIFLSFLSCYFGEYANTIRQHFFGDFHDAVNYVKTLPADKYYITSDTQYQGSKNVSEILTLFDFGIDAEYFQGKKELPGQLPYREKFNYFYTGEAWGNPEENAAYVITEQELDHFGLIEYRVVRFGNYYAVYN